LPALTGGNPLETPSEQALPYRTEPPEAVQTAPLEPIEYAYRRRRDVEIVIEQPEHTSVCPMTGLPDFGTIRIRYVPDRKIVELKSLKYYLLQYRNVGIFYEHMVNRILEDLAAVLSPKQLEVTGIFTARGGITTRVTAVQGDPQ
jgi:7-cyano-7-deazaguanine reductase